MQRSSFGFFSDEELYGGGSDHHWKWEYCEVQSGTISVRLQLRVLKLELDTGLHLFHHHRRLFSVLYLFRPAFACERSWDAW